MGRGAAAGVWAPTPAADVNGAVRFLCERGGFTPTDTHILKCGNFLLTVFWSQGALKQLSCEEGQSKEP